MVEFVEDGHYYVNSKGILIPSVSDLVSYLCDNSYKNVPQHILDSKAEYGTLLHSLLEQYDNGEIDLDKLHYSKIDPNLKSSLNQYAELKKKYMIYPKSQEVIVDYHERYAGRYDKLDKSNFLWDVKSTSSVYEEKWACQLGFYYLALGLQKDVGYVIWLPKKQNGKVILVKPWNNEQCLEGLEKYEKHHSD